jgi:DNA-binding FadR family transcriptional regulator
MLRERPTLSTLSEFLRYLANPDHDNSEGLPPLTKLSEELGISISALREQLEVARALGLVDVKPRTGTKRLAYTFTPAVRQSLSYALALNPEHFDLFADLRKHIELAYWHEAVEKLTEADRQDLRNLVERAWQKLEGTPVQIPHIEHRQLHLRIYCRLGNPFVSGILEAYWEAYEAIGLNVYTEYSYLQQVWRYHQSMVDSIWDGDYEAGYRALREHTDLIYHRPPTKT